MNYTVWGDNLQILPEVKIEAKTPKEAQEKYEEMWNNGELTVMGNELVTGYKPKQKKGVKNASKSTVR